MKVVDHRPLTPQERNWLVTALSTLPTGRYAGGGCWVDCETNQVKPLAEPIDSSPYLAQLDGLLVVGRCGCGQSNCHTVYFADFEPGTVVTPVIAITRTGELLTVGVDRVTGQLTELEVLEGCDSLCCVDGSGTYRMWPPETEEELACRTHRKIASTEMRSSGSKGEASSSPRRKVRQSSRPSSWRE